MRSILLSLALAGIVTLASPAASSIEITVGDRGGGVRWYRSPIWIAIGALAVIMILLLVIIAARSGGGGTTIIRE